MLLIEIRDWVANHKIGTLVQIAREFETPETAMADMLERWVKKGIIGKREISCQSDSACSSGGCGGCSFNKPTAPSIQYYWIH